MKKALIVLVSLVIIAVFPGGCKDNNESDSTTEAFNKQALSVYEDLLYSTDAQVVKELGKGEERFMADDDLEQGKSALYERVYPGCLLSEIGETLVRYALPPKSEVQTGNYQVSSSEVSAIVMSALLSQEEAAQLRESIYSMFGEPGWESTAFDINADYFGSWDSNKDHKYILLYNPPSEENNGKCSVVFGLEKSS